MSLTKSDIQTGFNALKKKAEKFVRKGAYNDAVNYLKACSSIAGQFNFQYADDDLEMLLKCVAEKTIKQVHEYEPFPDRWIFYDDFCTTYVVGLQWLEAMALSGRKILYITTRNLENDLKHKSIIDRVTQFENVEIAVIPQAGFIERAQVLYDTITRFRASKIVIHKKSSSILMNLVMPVLPNGLTRYIINISDQIFWLGAKSIDYCVEFRQFGASVSLQRRGLNREQLLMVPFYPADDRNDFEGFPPECTKDKTIVFSGGDFYKTLDDKRIYWQLIKKILNKYPQVVFLFATKNIPEGDRDIRNFIKENHLEGRFIYISFRQDIYQVFAHSDIYMGTSPTSGSLMSQLAAINAKPILQYYEPGTPDDETEQAICINDSFGISFHDEESFMREADRLITDEAYRQQQGERLQRAMMQHEQFNKLVLQTLETNQTQMPICDYPIDYEGLDNRWYYMEKAGYVNLSLYLYGKLGAFDCLRYAPMVFFKKNWHRFTKNVRKLF